MGQRQLAGDRSRRRSPAAIRFASASPSPSGRRKSFSARWRRTDIVCRRADGPCFAFVLRYPCDLPGHAGRVSRRRHAERGHLPLSCSRHDRAAFRSAARHGPHRFGRPPGRDSRLVGAASPVRQPPECAVSRRAIPGPAGQRGIRRRSSRHLALRRAARCPGPPLRLDSGRPANRERPDRQSRPRSMALAGGASQPRRIPDLPPVAAGFPREPARHHYPRVANGAERRPSGAGQRLQRRACGRHRRASSRRGLSGSCADRSGPGRVGRRPGHHRLRRPDGPS